MKFVRAPRRMAVCIWALLMGPFLASLACHAQDSNTARALTTEERVGLQNLTYLRVMQDKCPFPKNLAEDFELISMVIGMQLPAVGKSDMDDVAAKAEAIADKNIAVSKDVACERAEAAVQKMGEAMANASARGR